MAERVITIRTDDVTGEDGDNIETVSILVGADVFLVDMSPETYAAYRAAIEPYVSKGTKRKAGATVLRPAFGAKPVTAAASAGTTKDQRQIVRQWWLQNVGLEGIPPVSDRGRIPTIVQQLFSKYGGAAIPEPEKVTPLKAAPAKEIPPHHPSVSGRVGGVATTRRGTKTTAAPKPRKGASAAAKVTASAAPSVRRGRAKS